MSSSEYIDVCNEDGSSAGYSVSRKEIHEKGLWHRVVHVWIIDSNGMILIQKRSSTKESYAGRWCMASSGHIDAGMSSRETAIKETYEEVGLSFNESDLEFLFKFNRRYVLKNGKYIDNDIPDIYLISLSYPLNLSSLKLQVEEVEEAKLINVDELYNMLFSEVELFVPIFDRKLYSSIKDCPYNTFFQILSERYKK